MRTISRKRLVCCSRMRRSFVAGALRVFCNLSSVDEDSMREIRAQNSVQVSAAAMTTCNARKTRKKNNSGKRFTAAFACGESKR